LWTKNRPFSPKADQGSLLFAGGHHCQSDCGPESFIARFF